MQQVLCVLWKYLKASNNFINRILNTVFLPYKLTQVRQKKLLDLQGNTSHTHIHTHTHY